MRTRELVSGAAAGVVGGYAGTKVMNPFAYGAAAATAEILMSDRR